MSAKAVHRPDTMSLVFRIRKDAVSFERGRDGEEHLEIRVPTIDAGLLADRLREVGEMSLPNMTPQARRLLQDTWMDAAIDASAMDYLRQARVTD